MNWIITHWVDLLAIWGAVVAICSTIVKLTPTQKDDAFWAKVLKILDLFSVVFTKEDAEKIAQATKNLKGKK
jgi:hypothetical protein